MPRVAKLTPLESPDFAPLRLFDEAKVVLRMTAKEVEELYIAGYFKGAVFLHGAIPYTNKELLSQLFKEKAKQ